MKERLFLRAMLIVACALFIASITSCSSAGHTTSTCPAYSFTNQNCNARKDIQYQEDHMDYRGLE